MRAFVLLVSAASLALVGVGASTLDRKASVVSGHWEMVKGLDDAFDRTANLRSGVGRCGVGIARRPGLPTAFHAEAAATGFTGFERDESSGLWSQGVAEGSRYGSRFFADEAKKRPAGHLLVTALGKVGTKVDARYLAGEYAGTAFKADTKVAADGSGTVTASGKLPKNVVYALSGYWNETNVGTWTQRWDDPCLGSEEDTYATAADGTATLKIRSERGLALDLAFTPDRSGKGTVVDAKSGLKGTVEWDDQGDGAIRWADGATQPFEGWKV